MNGTTHDHIYFTVRDLMNLRRTLEEFIRTARQDNNAIIDLTNTLRSYWRDSQYDNFSQYIDGLTDDIDASLVGLVRANNLLNEYIEELLKAV